MAKNDLLIYGGLAIAGLFIVLLMSSPTMLEDIKYGISKLFNPNTQLPADVENIMNGGLNSSEEAAQAAMYSHYY